RAKVHIQVLFDKCSVPLLYAGPVRGNAQGTAGQGVEHCKVSLKDDQAPRHDQGRQDHQPSCNSIEKEAI
ncbi:hypothetical protein LPJ56_001667, partial [Coemansia sp. RSA 2599]